MFLSALQLSSIVKSKFNSSFSPPHSSFLFEFYDDVPLTIIALFSHILLFLFLRWSILIISDFVLACLWLKIVGIQSIFSGSSERLPKNEHIVLFSSAVTCSGRFSYQFIGVQIFLSYILESFVRIFRLISSKKFLMVSFKYTLAH